MGIRFSCPNGHKLNVKTFLAGKRAICPDCGAKVIVPNLSEPLTQSVAVDVPSRAATFGGPVPQEYVEADLPSVMIDIEENESPAATFSPATIATSAEPLPDSIIAATTPSIATDPHVAGAPESTYDSQRERTRRNQMLMAVALLFVVVILAGILFWVLKRSASPSPAIEPVPEKSASVSPARLPSLTQLKG